MHPLRKKLKNIPIIQKLASIKITVICLTLLFILTFWGTVAQVKDGLYLSQQKFFFSWGFLTFNVIPFPGAKLVLWIFFINLVCVSITRFVYKWSHLGIVIIHVGLLTYFAAAFVTFYATKESNVTLLESEQTNISTSYHDWEISIWEETSLPKKKIYAYDSNHLTTDTILNFSDLGFQMKTLEYHRNTQAFQDDVLKDKYINASGISFLKPMPFEIEPERNMPGAKFEIIAENKTAKILLFGGDQQPTKLSINNKTYNFDLRRKRFELPFTITLKKFDMEKHPGTEMAKNYQSLVEINHQNLDREVLIYMNNPLRHKDFTLYQASYSVDEMGQVRSTLAVVENAGRILPYISTFVTFVGLAIHFLMMAFRKEKANNA